MLDMVRSSDAMLADRNATIRFWGWSETSLRGWSVVGAWASSVRPFRKRDDRGPFTLKPRGVAHLSRGCNGQRWDSTQRARALPHTFPWSRGAHSRAGVVANKMLLDPGVNRWQASA